jgi:hypothetical protein
LGKLRVLSGKEVCAILARHGFVKVRQRGSHIVDAEANGRFDDNRSCPESLFSKNRHVTINHPTVRTAAIFV